MQISLQHMLGEFSTKRVGPIGTCIPVSVGLRHGSPYCGLPEIEVLAKAFRTEAMVWSAFPGLYGEPVLRIESHQESQKGSIAGGATRMRTLGKLGRTLPHDPNELCKVLFPCGIDGFYT